MKGSGGKGEEGGGSEEEKGDGRVKDRGGGWGKLQWVALFSRRQRNFHFPDVCSDNTSLKMKIKMDKKYFYVSESHFVPGSVYLLIPPRDKLFIYFYDIAYNPSSKSRRGVETLAIRT